MPTYDRSDVFKRDYKRLTAEERARFSTVVRNFIEDLTLIEEGKAKGFRPGLRVKSMQGHPGIWELTWEFVDGRATFTYGATVKGNKIHIEWRRCGSHDIYKNP